MFNYYSIKGLNNITYIFKCTYHLSKYSFIIYNFPYMYLHPQKTLKMCLLSLRNIYFFFLLQEATARKITTSSQSHLFWQVNVFNFVFQLNHQKQSQVVRHRRLLNTSFVPNRVSKDLVARILRAEGTTTGTEWAWLLSVELSTSLISPRGLSYMLISSNLCSLCLFSFDLHKYMMHITTLLGVL